MHTHLAGLLNPPSLIFLLWLAPMASVPAGEQAAPAAANPARLERDQGGHRLILENATLESALETLATAFAVPIQASHVPAGAVTLNCHGDTLRALLHCLLGQDADLVLEHGSRASRITGAERLARVRVLASTFERPGPWQAATPAEAAPPEHDQPAVMAALARLAAEHPGQRAEALDGLSRVQGLNPDELRAAYEQGLQDRSGEVRATALSGLAVLDPAGSQPLLAGALDDQDADVRLSAVDGLEVNAQTRPWLERALGDPDESVRELAGLRLGIIR